MTLDIHKFHDVPNVFDKPEYRKAHDARIDELRWCLDRIDSGTVLEFGVYEGKTLRMMAEYRPDLKFVGFDSFEGLPEDWFLGEKIVKKERFITDVPTMPDNVNLVLGFFDESLPKWIDNNWFEPIRFINIDSDLYSSARTVLEEMNTLIVPDQLLRFDELCEWRIEPFYSKEQQKKDRRIPQRKYTRWEEGEWRALNEWIDKYNRHVRPIARNYSQSSVMEVIV